MPPTEQLPFDLERLAADKEYREELRHRVITDGFFLAPLLGYNDFIRRIHQPVADLYVQKCPGLPIQDQHPIKKRMHLDPRHTFKTTWGFIDTVQWVLSQPDITIANVTATQNLGKLLVKRLNKVFEQPKTKPPTALQILFPEYVVPGRIKGDYIAPCRTRDEVEPTIYATSPGSSQSGWHPWMVNPDDMVDNINSGIKASDESREKIWDTWATNLNTLRHGGYVNVRGTRYHPFDAYGRMLKNEDPGEWKKLIRSSMRVKALDQWGNPKRLVEGEFPAEEDVELYFEELLPYSKLKTLFKDYGPFMCQQQNDPSGGGVSIFPPQRYAQAQIAEERLPSIGDVRICWRLPCSSKTFMQYAEGVAVRYVGSRAYVVEAWRGIYTPTELYERIVMGAKRLNCNDLIIENTPGSDPAIADIYNEAIRRNWSIRIDRPDYQSDDAERKGRLQQLEPRMQAGRLWFSTGLLQADEVRNQFTNFGMIESNGFVDCVSRLSNRLPASIMAEAVTREQRAMLAEAKERGIYDYIFGQGGAVEVEEAIIAKHHESQIPQNSYGLSPLLGGLDG